MKKLVSFILILFIFSSRPPCYAAGLSQGEARVFDYAGLFTAEEAAGLEERAGQLRDSMKAEVVILTVADGEGKDSQHIADQFYFDQGFGDSFHENGILMLIDMDNRECYLGAYGSMIRILTDERIGQILDQAIASAGSGNYAEAALTGVEEAYGCFQKGISSNQYNYNVETGEISVYRSIRWYEALFALAVSSVVAALVCSGVVQRYQMEDSGAESAGLAYQAGCRFQFCNPSDNLVNTMVTHTMIPRQPSGGAGGGRSSSGRSSTHSYGGHQAGGGGKKF